MCLLATQVSAEYQLFKKIMIHEKQTDEKKDFLFWCLDTNIFLKYTTRFPAQLHIKLHQNVNVFFPDISGYCAFSVHWSRRIERKIHF